MLFVCQGHGVASGKAKEISLSQMEALKANANIS